MTNEVPEEEGPLARWLRGEGLAALDAVLAGAPDVVAVFDLQLVFRYINWTGPSMTREQVLGRNLLDVVPAEYRAHARQMSTRVLQSGQGANFEMAYRAGDEVRMWEARIGPIRHERELVGLVILASNVTEQRRADADRDRFFSLSLDMLVVVAPDGRFTRVNPAFGEALGYPVSALIGMPFMELLDPDDRERSQAAFERLLRGNPITDFENRYRRRDGSYRVFSWRGTADPVTGFAYAVARDITEQRAVETQLRQAQKMEAVGQLAGGIAHDFNNLMLAVLANAELALHGTAHASPLAEHLSEIASAGRRAADLTKQLLAFSRRQPLRTEPVDLNQLVHGLMKMLRRLLPEHIEIEFVAAADLPSVRADPTQLEQVLVNLCVNARDAMQDGGTLTIETSVAAGDQHAGERQPGAESARYVCWCVRDTGSGMTPEVRERAFEPFFTTKGAHLGTGLGLSTVYGIVQQHDGVVRSDSVPGRGTCFEIYLPADDRDGRSARAASEVARATPAAARETILVAEDEESVRRPLLQILEAAGYRTLAAANGVEAIALLHQQTAPVHLVLLDVVMPELGGPATWERMRAMNTGVRVLFTSGYADNRYLARLPMGVEVLEKPFRADELLMRIRALLDA